MEPSRDRSGWILVAGLALACLGLVAESRPQEEIPPPGGNSPGGPGVPGGTAPPPAVTPTLPPTTSGYGTADSNGSMIAVTGVDVTGGSLLFLIDTETKHLSVYQAIGGTKSTMNIKWVGGRNITLDMEVDGYNDQSQYSYKELAEQFGKKPSGD